MPLCADVYQAQQKPRILLRKPFHPFRDALQLLIGADHKKMPYGKNRTA